MRTTIFAALIAVGLVAIGCGDDPVDTPVFGEIEVVTVTTGNVIDGDGYTITVSAGGDERTEDIGANSDVTISNLTPGTKSLLLGDIALNCQTTDNPRDVNVVAGQTATTQFNVTCAAPNLPPDADAGPNQAPVDLDNSGFEDVTLDGSGSVDIDGEIVSWTWSVNGAVFGTGETLTVSAAVGVYTIILTVEDDEGATATDDVVINVIPTDANQLPTADAGPNQSVLDAGDTGFETVTLDGSASTDADGTIVSWDWTDGVDDWTGETVDVDFPVGIHSVLLTVTDDEGEVDTDGVTITVVPTGGNRPPVANAGPDQTRVDGDFSGTTPVLLDGSGSTDLDGEIVSWVWAVDGTDLGTGETLATELPVGVTTVILTVTDDEGAIDSDDVTIIVQKGTITGVSIFESTDYNGDGLLLRNDVSDLADLTGPCAGTWDDCIASISLSNLAWTAILFELAGFEGDSLLVTGSFWDLSTADTSRGGNWGRFASSIKVFPPGTYPY